MIISKNILQCVKKIKLLILDVDGILTNGKIYMTSQGEEIIQFHVHDGMGIKRLSESGVEIAIISSRKTNAVSTRAKNLNIRHVFLGQKNKLNAYQLLLKKLNLTSAQVAYMGDDLPDEVVMKKVALPITVPNAAGEIKKISKFQTKQKAGNGAVREVCDLIYNTQQRA
ncbi:MAG: hypothetical protein ACD_46C00534G0002 [uncultured bacterium]|nr:MAG: hypothetical protein ACD_46C00534G0002 [uncultured bacterium]